MDELEIEHRITAIEQRAASNTHRLDKLEPLIDEIHTLSKTMIQLVEEIKHTNAAVESLDQKIERMDGRVDEMERAPADDAKIYKRTAVTAAISTIAGAFATGLIFFISQFL